MLPCLDSLVALAETYAQSTLITISGARHYLMVTHVDPLKENILVWMDTQKTAE